MKKVKSIIKKITDKIDYKDVIIFLIPFMACIFYLVLFYPGVLSYDSYNQINQIKGMTFNTDHPFFHTFIEMMLLKIVNTPAIIGFFQISVFSLLWTKICKYNRANHNFNFYYQIPLTILIIINPLNKILSITLWKDVLYSYAILWLSFEIEKIVDNKFVIDLKELIKVSFILALLPNLRHNGYLLTLGIGLILFIVFIVKDKKRFNYLKMAGFLVVFILGFKGLNKLYNVTPGMGVGDMGSIIDYKLLAVTGEIGRYGYYTDEDQAEINKYIDYDCIISNSSYNALDGMWVYCDPKPELMRSNRKELYKTIFSMVSRNLKVSINFYLKQWGFVWRIVRYDDSWGNINYYGITAVNARPNYTRIFQATPLLNFLERYIYLTRTNKVFQTIFYSGSLCLYLSIIILVTVRKVGKKKYFLVFLPTLLNTVGIALTASVNDVRYYYSNFLVLYLLGAILFKCLLENEK